MGVHIAGVISLISSAPALAAYVFRNRLPLPASITLWYVASAGMTVAVAATERFARHTTGLLGKTPEGTISPLGLAVFWPYHLGLRTKLAIQRRVSSERSWDQITPQYFLGAWPSEEALVPVIKPAILDVTCELPLQVKPPVYKVLPVWDTHAPTVAQIEQGVQFGVEQAATGRPVLVHCAHGHGRSATLLAAILIAEGTAQNIEQAEAIMKAARPKVRLNTRQRASLKQWVDLRKVAVKKQ